MCTILLNELGSKGLWKKDAEVYNIFRLTCVYKDNKYLQDIG